LNGILVGYLTSALKSQSDLIIVIEAMTNDYPGESAVKVLDKLKKKYPPKDGITEFDV
jgi:hypothetical protein